MSKVPPDPSPLFFLPFLDIRGIQALPAFGSAASHDSSLVGAQDRGSNVCGLNSSSISRRARAFQSRNGAVPLTVVVSRDSRQVSRFSVRIRKHPLLRLAVGAERSSVPSRLAASPCQPARACPTRPSDGSRDKSAGLQRAEV